MSKLPNNKDKNKQYDRKKRKYNELEDNSDEDILVDEHFGSNEDDDSKKIKYSKNTKLLGTNYQNLRQMRLLQKLNNKENNFLSQEQLDFAKKVVEQNTNINKQKDVEENSKKVDEVEIKSNKNNINNKQKEKEIKVVSPDINFSIKKDLNRDKEKISDFVKENQINPIDSNPLDTNDTLIYLGILNACEYKICKNDTEFFSLEMKIEKNEKEQMKFIVNFRKQGEDKDFVEYIPLLTTFQLEGDDTLFYEELEIHKEDLGKMIKRLLIYKYK
jgi:hypothetical protein